MRPPRLRQLGGYDGDVSNYPTDGSNPPTVVTVGPYVQLGVDAAGTPIITRLTPPPGQLTPGTN